MKMSLLPIDSKRVRQSHGWLLPGWRSWWRVGLIGQLFGAGETCKPLPMSETSEGRGFEPRSRHLTMWRLVTVPVARVSGCIDA